jgi:hypothetical protein
LRKQKQITGREHTITDQIQVISKCLPGIKKNSIDSKARALDKEKEIQRSNNKIPGKRLNMSQAGKA